MMKLIKATRVTERGHAKGGFNVSTPGPRFGFMWWKWVPRLKIHKVTHGEHKGLRIIELVWLCYVLTYWTRHHYSIVFDVEPPIQKPWL